MVTTAMNAGSTGAGGSSRSAAAPNINVSSLTNPDAGRGGRGGARGRRARARARARARGNRGDNNGRTPGPTTPPPEVFKGREPALKGHIHSITDPSESGSMFRKTTKELAEHCGRELKMGNCVKRAMEPRTNLVPHRPTRPVPDDQGNVNQTDLNVHNEEIKQVHERRTFNASQCAESPLAVNAVMKSARSWILSPMWKPSQTMEIPSDHCSTSRQ